MRWVPAKNHSDLKRGAVMMKNDVSSPNVQLVKTELDISAEGWNKTVPSGIRPQSSALQTLGNSYKC